MSTTIMTQEEKDKIIELYLQGYNTVEIGKMIDRNNSTIVRYLVKNGYKNYGLKCKLTIKDRENIINLYNDKKMCSREIYKLYKDKCLCEETIQRIVKEAGVSRANGRRAVLNHNYFEEINTEKKAYFLGLIMADGCVMKLKRSKNGYSYVTSISLIEEDKYLLEELCKEVESNLKVKTYYRENKGKTSQIAFHSKKMFNDLGNMELFLLKV